MKNNRFEYPSVDQVIKHLEILWNSDLFAAAISTLDEGKIIAANPHFLSTLGYTREEVIGKSSTELGLWTDLEKRNARTRNILERQVEQNEMVQMRAKSGEIKHMMVSAQMIKVNGVLCGLGMGTDMTEQMRMKNNLAEANRQLIESKRHLSIAKAAAESASSAKGAFLANMSHEIRTPLSIIQGFIELLLEEEWPEKQLGYLQRVQSSSLYLRELIDKVLDMSKIEAQEEPINPDRFVLGEKLGDIVEALAAQAEQKGISFKTDLDAVWNVEMNTDPIRVIQILNNLCTNAMKFTKIGGVTLSGRLAPADGYDCLILRISDTGVGIPENVRDQLFNIFTQVHNPSEFAGAGLGLYLSRQLARKLGGDVELIESNAGRGSVFEVRLRTDITRGARAVTRMDSNTVHQSGFSLKNYKILAAEDNESMRMIIEGMVTQLGGGVKIVADGLELIASAQDERPHLILLDNRMPKMDGIEAARILRRKGFSGKIIALTASAFEQERGELLRAGCDDVLTKPFNLSAFTDILRRQLAERRLSSLH